jgi:hypothetical protein
MSGWVYLLIAHFMRTNRYKLAYEWKKRML